MEFKPKILRVVSLSQDTFDRPQKISSEACQKQTNLKSTKCIYPKRVFQQHAANKLQRRCNNMFQSLNEISPHRKPRVQLEKNTDFITLRLPLVYPKCKDSESEEMGNCYMVEEENPLNGLIEPKKEPFCDLWEQSDTIEFAVEPDNKFHTSQKFLSPFRVENDIKGETDHEVEYKFDNNDYTTIYDEKSTFFAVGTQEDMQSESSLSSVNENLITLTRDPPPMAPILQTENSLGFRYKSNDPRPHGMYCQTCFKYLPIEGQNVALIVDLESIAMEKHIKGCHPKETASDISFIRSYSYFRFRSAFSKKCPCGHQMTSKKSHFQHFKAHYDKYVDGSSELVYCSICAEIVHSEYFDTHRTKDHEPTGMVPVSRSVKSQLCTVCQSKPCGSLACHLHRHRVGTLTISTRPASFEDAPHYCRICGTVLPFFRLNEHYASYHPTCSSDVRSFAFSGDFSKCQICSCATFTLLDLYKHLQSHNITQSAS
ncbi:unnamed protein product [Owenia fusiformis]|uniref:Uncharacterized protein n=1 Tax=Owenia fusiformis TaxID=6347 RepID=A0A8S4N228_OWEFU|nr:unnamed protein product [Owenia fusiformis]